MGENYIIKLLQDNNLVLVERKNYEPEIFTPLVVDGRITFLNIIPNRRCCQISKSNVINFKTRQLQKSSNCLSEQNFVQHSEMLPISQCLASSTPLAKNIPVDLMLRRSCSNQFQLLNTNSRLSVADYTLPTPEPARRAVPARSALSPFNLHSGVIVSKIYQNRTPKKVSSLISSGSKVRYAQNSANISLLDGNFVLPCTPISTKRSNNKKQTKNFVHSTPNKDCIERWQKVLTPVRTYSRKLAKPVTINRPKTVDKLKKVEPKYKVTPTFLYNPTQGLDVSQKIVIKRRRIIVDKKTTISPKTFKKQQLVVDSPTTTSSFRLHPQSLSFHKPRSYLDTIGMSAFDLLTNSNRKRIIATKLNEQFRKRCINKASSTLPKYKVLSSVPPIEQDEQVLELSRIF